MTFLMIGLQLISAATAGAAAFYWHKSARLLAPDFTIIGVYSPQAHQIAPISAWARDTCWCLSRYGLLAC